VLTQLKLIKVSGQELNNRDKLMTTIKTYLELETFGRREARTANNA